MTISRIFAAFLLISLTSFSFAGTLFVNQAGYSPLLPKFVYYNANADSFFIIESGTETIHFKGAFQLFTSSDAATGMMMYQGDFSSFTKAGTYYIRTNTNDVSYQFSISPGVYEDVWKKSLKAFYFQRCGFPLTSLNAGIYSRPACHTADAMFHSTTGESGIHLSPRGWHDAGDYGKYIVNAGISAGTRQGLVRTCWPAGR